MPYANAHNFTIIYFPFDPNFALFWKQSLTFYTEDNVVLEAQTNFNRFEIVQATLNATGGKCILKVAVDKYGNRLIGAGNIVVPTCPPLDEKRGQLVPDVDLPGLIP